MAFQNQFDQIDFRPMYKPQLLTAQDRESSMVLRNLLEANARSNKERRDAVKNDIRRVVDATGQSNPDL